MSRAGDALQTQIDRPGISPVTFGTDARREYQGLTLEAMLGINQEGVSDAVQNFRQNLFRQQNPDWIERLISSSELEHNRKEIQTLHSFLQARDDQRKVAMSST